MDTKEFIPTEKFYQKYNGYPEIWSNNRGAHKITIVQSPVANCQHFSICGFEIILETYDVRKQLSEIKKIFAYPKTNPRQNVIVDVAYGYKERIHELFSDEEILSESVYTSSNDNIRILYLLSLKNL